MNIEEIGNQILAIFSGLKLDERMSLKKAAVIAFTTFSLMFLIVFGFSYSGWEGLIRFIFNISYPEYKDFNIIKIFVYEGLFFYAISLNILSSLAITISSIIFFVIKSKKGIKILNVHLIGNIFLFVSRCISICSLILPFIAPPILKSLFDHSIFPTHNSVEYNTFEIFKQNLSIIYWCLFLSLIFMVSYVVRPISLLEKRLIKEKKDFILWFEKNFSLTSWLIFAVGLVIYCILSSVYNNYFQMNFIDQKSFNLNYCEYKRVTPLSSKGEKAIIDEFGCEKVAACYSLSDEYIIKDCINNLYKNSHYFKTQVKCHPNDDICI